MTGIAAKRPTATMWITAVATSAMASTPCVACHSS